VVVRVSNDYLIQSSFIYTEKESGGHDTSGDTMSFYNTMYWRNVAQAEGNIKDESNITTVKVDFGYQVASLNYGFNAQFNYLGFKVNGELVTNENHFMFPDGAPGTGNPSYNIHGLPPRTGHQYAERDKAYYVTVQKDWERIGFSAEVFKMGKFYRPYLDFFTKPDNRDNGRLQGEIAPRHFTRSWESARLAVLLFRFESEMSGSGGIPTQLLKKSRRSPARRSVPGFSVRLKRRSRTATPASVL